jgi:DNA-3-methyladenine glycosylase II
MTGGTAHFQSSSGEDSPINAGYRRRMNTVDLPYIPPWNWLQFHQYFALRLLHGVEVLEPERYSRSVRIGECAGWFSVRPSHEQPVLVLTVSDSLREHLPWLSMRVRKMFDLDNDPAEIARHFAADADLGPLVAANPGLRLPTAFDPFEQAVRAIVGQQVTVKAAVTITRRLVDRLGDDMVFSAANEAPGLLKLFPNANTIAAAELENIGMPGKRVATLKRLAAAINDGALELHIDNGVDELVSRLCKLPGIGPWTAQYIALRGFGEADAFPAADLGLLKAPLWGSDGISTRALLERSEAWRPWRAYAAVHIWQNYSEAAAASGLGRVKAAKFSPTPLANR